MNRPTTRPSMKFVRVLVMAATLFVASGAHSAEDQVFGDWSVGVTTSKDYVYAATVNDSGALFGEYCSLKDGICNWILGMDVSCQSSDGKKAHPTLANADGGSATLSVICGGKVDKDNYRYVFSNWEELESTIDEGTRVGFAFPLESGQFKVVRFSLLGWKQAAAMAEGATEKVSQTSTRNQTL